MVFGFSSSFFKNTGEKSPAGKILIRLLHMIQEFSVEKVMESGDMVKDQFEQIQMMNNELVNTQRSLQKS